MAQSGDTITYTFTGTVNSNNRLIPTTEDVSAIDAAIVEYVDGAGSTDDARGGRVENAVIDVSSQNTLYIWVGGTDVDSLGRYKGGEALEKTAGSTEISFTNTNAADSSDEPFLVAAGSGGSIFGESPSLGGGGNNTYSSGGARGGTGYGSEAEDGEGNPPPLGGDGAVDSSSQPQSGGGAIDDQNRGLVSGGTTIEGSGSATNGEVQITYESAPAAPTNLTASIN